MAVGRRVAFRLVVDPVACDGFGHCAELAPDLVHLDEWGYPLLTPDPFPSTDREAVRSAQLAIRGCPRNALRLERINLA
jgi:ferredoxin